MNSCHVDTRLNARDSLFARVCRLLVMRLELGIHEWRRRGVKTPPTPELGWTRYNGSCGMCYKLVRFQSLLVTIAGLDWDVGPAKLLCMMNRE